MSSTVNVQNLLTNVFRPTFVYDTANSVYQTKLELTNIDTVSANNIKVYAADIGDANANVYVGVGAGNSHFISPDPGNLSNTFVGTGAGGSTSNVQNGVFIGYNAGYGTISSSNSISIGANTRNGGNSNIYVGCGTGIVSGSNNIYIGAGLSNGTNPTSNTLLVGSGTNITMVGDLSNKKIGINMSSLPSTSIPLSLDVNGYARVANGGLGINMEPGSHSLQVNGNMQVSDGYGIFTFDHDSSNNTIATISNTPSYASSNATLQVTGGFFSRSGATLGDTLQVPLKKGMFILSTISNSTAQGYVGIYSGIYQTVVSSNTGTFITSNATNVTINPNVTWCITYFPSP